MDYANEEPNYGMLGAKQMRNAALSNQICRPSETKALDRCIGEANVIREQLAEAARVADGILARLAGPCPEATGEEAEKATDNGGVIGELQRIHGSSVSYLADIRRTLEQIGTYV